MSYDILDPLHIVSRTGSDDNPYVQIDESIKIINNIITLSELPDRFHKVFITGYFEIYDGIPTSTQFTVNYQNGIITFNPTENGKSVSVSYFGKGYILYPANRIIVHNDNPDIVITLQNIVDQGNSAVVAIDTLNQKITETNQAIVDAQQATTNANSAAESVTSALIDANAAAIAANSAAIDASDSAIEAQSASDNANAAASIANTSAGSANAAATSANNATSAANTATSNANNATTAANTATTNANNAATLANNAATAANTAKTNADTATANANTATTNANNAATAANNAATVANTVAINTAAVGAWSNATAYKKNNIVTYNGSSYIALSDNTNQTPTNITYWQIIASKGDTGATGAIGITWRGVWNSSATYSPNDTVSYNGTTYICTSASPSGTAPTDTSKWNVIAAKGNDGAGTVAGITSTNGDIIIGGTATNPTITINSGNTGANKILKLDINGQVPATVVLDDATHRFATDSEKSSWNALASGSTNGKMSSSDFTKLSGISTGANKVTSSSTNGNIKVDNVELIVYTHPTGDGSLHIPITGTTNNNKVLKAGATAGVISWANVDWSELTNKPSTFAPPIATSAVLGGVKQGSNTTIAADGTISVAAPYSHPTGDGNLHVPITGTTNNGKVLKSGSTAGSISWSSVDWSELTNKPSTFAPSTHVHTWGDITSGKPTTLVGYGITDAASSTHNHDGIYAKLTGGTFTGDIVISSGVLTINGGKNWGNQSAEPLNPSDGDEYYNIVSHKKFYFNGTSWIDLLAYA